MISSWICLTSTAFSFSFAEMMTLVCFSMLNLQWIAADLHSVAEMTHFFEDEALYVSWVGYSRTENGNWKV